MVFELKSTCHKLFICNDPENYYIIIVWKQYNSTKYCPWVAQRDHHLALLSVKTLSKLIATWSVCVIMRYNVNARELTLFSILSNLFVTRCLHPKKTFPKVPEYDDQILLFLLTLLEEKSSITTSVFISSNFSFSMHKVARIYFFFTFFSHW